MRNFARFIRKRGSPIQVVGFAVKGNNITTGNSISYASDFVAPGGGAVVPATGDFIIVLSVHAGAANNSNIRNTINQNVSGAMTDTTAVQIAVSDSNYCSSGMRHAFKGASDTTITLPGVNGVPDTMATIAVALRGVNVTTPIDVTPTTVATASTGQPNCPAITPVTAGALILEFAGAAQGTGADFSAPADMIAAFKSFFMNNGTDAAVACAIKNDWTSGAFDPAAWTGSTTNAADSCVGYTVAIRPA
jgi:hypothetical protein